MSDRRLFFIGWEYHTPAMNTLKSALGDPAFPWSIGAIVHDAIWVERVDGIPLMTTEDFWARCDLADIDVLVLLKNAPQRALWARRLRDRGIRLVDEGELLHEYANELTRLGVSRSLGATRLPEAFDDHALAALQQWRGRWSELASNRVFNGYLGFLQSGLVALLAEVDSGLAGEHPYFSPRDAHVEQFKLVGSAGLIWEIAEARSAFLEQGVINHNIGAYSYAFSAFDRHHALSEGHRLDLLFKPFGLTPALSTLSLAGERVIQHAAGRAPQPDEQASTKHVRIDVAEPFPLLRWLQGNTRQLLARVRIHKPADLLLCLQHLPMESLSLRCDRPGSSGLELTFSTLPPAGTAA